MRTQVFYRDAQGLEGVVELRGEPIFIGRAMECAIRTDDGMVSRRHARIFRDAGRWWIEDLGSANGIYVDTTRVSRHCMVHGEAIRCGSLWLRFVDETGASATPFQSVGQAPGGFQSPGIHLNVQPMGAGGAMAPPPGISQPIMPGMVPPMQPMAPLPMAPLAPQGGGGAFIPASAGPAFIPASAPVGGARSTGNSPQGGGMSGSSAEAAELRTQLDKAISEKATLEAEIRALRDGNKETQKLQRRIDQLTSDLKRLRGGKDEGQSPLDKLEAEFAALGKERDELLVKIKELENRVEAANKMPAEKKASLTKTRAAEAHTELNDVLSQVRINVRTLGDELENILATLPGESKEVVENALRESKEQLETARVLLRDIRTAIDG